MKQLELEVRDLLIGCPPIKIVSEEGMEEFGDIVDIKRDIIYGQVEVTEEGKLLSLTIDQEEIIANNDVSLDEYEKLSIDELKGIGRDFIDEYIAHDVELTAFEEWGVDTFMLTYEAMDTQYKIPLPNSGVVLEMNRQGFILSATLNQAYYQLQYPEVKISPEEALEIYTNRPLVELQATEFGEELNLVYYPLYDNEGVSVTGEIINIEDLQEEDSTQQLQAIAKVTPAYTKEELLGITADLRLDTSEEGVQKYLLTEEQAVIIDETIEGQLTIDSSLPFKDTKELDIAELKKHALAFMELTVGNIDEKYVLEDVFIDEDEDEEDEDELTPEEIALLEELSEEEDDEEDEDDEEYEMEPFVTFAFHRRLKGVALNDYNAHIDIGIYSGLVKDAVIPLLTEEQAETLPLQAAVSIEKANLIYKSMIKLELGRVAKEEEDFIVYDLCYVVKERVAGRRVDCIEAQTGEITYHANMGEETIELED